MARRPGFIAFLLLFSVAFGCEDESVSTYVAPIESEPQVQLTTTEAGAPAAPPSRDAATWQAPDGWDADPDPAPPIDHAFDIRDTDPPLRVTVSRLAGTGGGTLANINRWRGQVGLDPVASLDETGMSAVEIGQDAAALLDIAGPADGDGSAVRILAVIYPRQDANETIFYKLTGPADALDAHLDTFVRFVQSTRFEGADP